MKSLIENILDGMSSDGKTFLALMSMMICAVLLFGGGIGLFTSINEAQTTKQMELTNESKRLDIELLQLKGNTNEQGSGTDRGSQSSVKLEDRTQGP